MHYKHHYRKLIICLFALVLCTLTSCGIITKTRYGNGFKMELSIKKGEGADSAYVNKYIINKKSYRVKNQENRETAIDLKSHFSPAPNTLTPLNNYSINSTLGSEHIDKPRPFSKDIETPHEKLVSDTTKPVSGRKDVPKPHIEPHAKASGFLFYGGFIGYIISLIAAYGLPSLVFLSFLPFIFGIVMLVGFIFAIIGLAKIRDARKYDNVSLRGKGIAISVIVLYGLGIIYALASILFLYLILASIF